MGKINKARIKIDLEIEKLNFSIYSKSCLWMYRISF